MEEAAMTPTFRSVFPYLLVIIIDFYILPLLILSLIHISEPTRH